MTARRPAALALLTALAIGVAIAPTTRAQEADPGGGAAVDAQVPSILELSVRRGGLGVLTAEVTASIPRTQLLAAFPERAPGSSLRIGVGGETPRPVRRSQRLELTGWKHATTRSRVVMRTHVSPARAQARAVLEITAAPQTP